MYRRKYFFRTIWIILHSWVWPTDPCTRSLQQLHYIHQVDDISVSTIYSEVKVGQLQLRANIVIFPVEENRPICRREFVLGNFISSHFFWYFEPRLFKPKKREIPLECEEFYYEIEDGSQIFDKVSFENYELTNYAFDTNWGWVPKAFSDKFVSKFGDKFSGSPYSVTNLVMRNTR